MLAVSCRLREGTPPSSPLPSLRSWRTKPNALRLLDELFVNPYLTAARAAQILASSRPTARQAIGLLQAEGILQEVSGSSWRRIYLARPILEVIEERA